MAHAQDNVLRELDPIGKYRIRILALDGGKQALDIREYVNEAKFVGFTRRGIRLEVPTETATLEGALQAISNGDKPGKNSKKAATASRKKR